jgi:ribonuclease VapC
MFLDASAVVAIIAGEPDSAELRQKLKRHRRRTMSAMAAFEAALALGRIRNVPVDEAFDLVVQFKRIYAVADVSIESRFAGLAIQAFRRYGRGQGHKAKLNMGDCFSYACAKDGNVPLLCKGDDFIHTDIKIA